MFVCDISVTYSMLTLHTSTKQVIEGHVHKYQNTTIIKSDSIKVFTEQYIQQIIAPNLTMLNFVMREQLSEALLFLHSQDFSSLYSYKIKN